MLVQSYRVCQLVYQPTQQALSTVMVLLSHQLWLQCTRPSSHQHQLCRHQSIKHTLLQPFHTQPHWPTAVTVMVHICGKHPAHAHTNTKTNTQPSHTHTHTRLHDAVTPSTVLMPFKQQRCREATQFVTFNSVHSILKLAINFFFHLQMST